MSTTRRGFFGRALAGFAAVLGYKALPAVATDPVTGIGLSYVTQFDQAIPVTLSPGLTGRYGWTSTVVMSKEDAERIIRPSSDFVFFVDGGK